MESYLDVRNYFLNEANIPELFVWKIINTKTPSSFTIFKNGVVFLMLEKIRKIQYVQSNVIFNQSGKINDFDDSNFDCDNIKRIELVTNANMDQVENEFLLFSFFETPGLITDLYTFGNDTQKVDIPESDNDNDLTIDKIWIFSLNELRTLTNLDPTLIKSMIDVKPLINVEELILKIENSVFIQSIEVVGDLINWKSGELIENINLDLEYDNSKLDFIPQFVNPVVVNNEISNFYLSTLNNNFQLDLTSFLKQLDTNLKFNLVSYLSDNDAVKLIEDCIFVSKVVASGYSGMKPNDITEFKEKFYNGNDPQQYCDFKIQNFITQKSNNQDLVNKTLAIILALSFQIKSSYCWKGGFTQEHLLGLMFYVYETNKNYYLKSHYFNFKNENGKWKLLNKNLGLFKNNTFILGDRIITLPMLGKNLEEQTFTNTPLDFNVKSFNFNYITWTPVNKGKIIDYFLKDFSEKEVVQKYEMYGTKSLAFWSNYKNNKKLWEEDLRLKFNLPSTVILQANSLEMINISPYYDVVWENSRPIQKLGGYNYIIHGYFSQKDIIITSSNQPIIKNDLDYRKLLQSKNLYELINLKLTLNKKLTDEKWSIKQINKVIISHILGSNLVLEIKDKNNKNITFETKMMNQVNKRLSQTIVYLST